MKSFGWIRPGMPGNSRGGSSAPTAIRALRAARCRSGRRLTACTRRSGKRWRYIASPDAPASAPLVRAVEESGGLLCHDPDPVELVVAQPPLPAHEVRATVEPGLVRLLDGR